MSEGTRIIAKSTPEKQTSLQSEVIPNPMDLDQPDPDLPFSTDDKCKLSHNIVNLTLFI